MEPIEVFKSFGLLSIIIMISAGSYMVLKGPRDKTKSVSFHAGTANKKLYIFYALTFLVATGLFYLFCIFWFIPTFALSLGFTVSLHIMALLLILTAFIPQVGKKVKAHAIVAYGFAFIMMLLLVFVVTSPNISVFPRVFSGVTVVWMATGWYLLFFSPYKLKFRSHYLFYQYSYVILFFLSILAATYIR